MFNDLYYKYLNNVNTYVYKETVYFEKILNGLASYIINGFILKLTKNFC